MDLFDKCYNPKENSALYDAKVAEEKGLYPYFLPFEGTEGTEVLYKGRKIIMLGSNNYLGLTHHPKVKEAAKKAIDEYGTSATGSRFMNGTLKIHRDLEDALSEFLNKEAVIVFSTGYQTNLGTISALLSPKDYAIMDKEDHASIVDGWSMSHAKFARFNHNDVKSLENVLSKIPDDAGKLIVVDGVYSMAGDIAPLPEIVELKNKYGARLMVDDAHSIGVLGRNGRGTANHFNLENEVDLIMGTFSKSFASLGGFIAGDREVINYIKHYARPFIFSAAMTPASAAAALAALQIMQEEPERIEHLWNIANRMRKGLKELGFDIGASNTPIIPVYIRDKWKTVMMWKELFELGVYTNPVFPPAVQPNDSLLRTSYIATHTEEQIDKALSIFEKAGKKLGII
ncbi:MAG: aminotransferase class I/II-fold pyridoxal phosphate-dependent enzyme [Caldisericum sp.]|jgi:8-amino-7-oxononanoate synthase|uniref:8-amino-7-oxononanoate synthase n=3 Tax=Caldisericum TaxID=693074 RepID=A0A2J6WFB2_9BACT|nr:MAG: 8-amino-7-oxononanoate synthase [Caldisericum exile]